MSQVIQDLTKSKISLLIKFFTKGYSFIKKNYGKMNDYFGLTGSPGEQIIYYGSLSFGIILMAYFGIMVNIVWA